MTKKMTTLGNSFIRRAPSQPMIIFGLIPVWMLFLLSCSFSVVIPTATHNPPTSIPSVTQSPSATVTATTPPTVEPTPTPTVTDTPQPSSTPTDTQPAPSPTPASPFVMVEIFPAQGDLATLLRAEVEKAHVLGLKPFAEFDAEWCPACQAIAESLREKNPLMIDAFSGTYIIRLDVDQWEDDQWELAGFSLEFIPIFFRLDEEGWPTGESIDGGAWGENIPENMAPPLKEFFAQ